MSALHQLPAQLREIAEHPHAGGVFVALALERAELRRAPRLLLDECGDAFLVARDLSVEHLPRKAEETSFGQALEGGFQRDDSSGHRHAFESHGRHGPDPPLAVARTTA